MGDEAVERIEQLETRVAVLELELERLRTTAVAAAPPPPPPPRPAKPPVAMPPPPTGAPIIAAPKPPRERQPLVVESETALKWGGVGLVVLAVGFAVSTAIRRGWIGPELQLVGAVAISLALIAVGLHLRPTRLPWTHALCSGGVAALFTTVASNLFVDQTSNNTAYTCTAAIGLGGYALARLVPSQWVGAVTLGGGIIAWSVIADGEPPVYASLGWVVAIVAVALLLALEQRWFALRLMAHVAGLLGILAMAGEADQSGEQVMVLLAAALLYLSLVSVPSIGDADSNWHQLEIQLAAVAGPWAFGVIALALDLDDDTVIGAVGIAVAVFTAIVAFSARQWIHRAHFISILIGASVALSIGLGVLLSTTVFFVALAIQGAGLVVFGRSLGGNLRVSINAAVLEFFAAGFVLADMVDAWDFDAPAGDDIAHFVIIAAIAVAGWQTNERIVQQLTAASVLGLVLIWLGSVLVHLPQGQAAVSVSWAIVGTAVLLTGAMRKMPELGVAGLAVLALTVAKLLTVDLREVDALWRAGLFFIVGVALMRLGFLLPRLTGMDRDQGNARDQSDQRIAQDQPDQRIEA